MLELWKKTLQLHSNNDYIFNNIALKVFQFQYANNLIYKQFVDLLGTNINNIQTWKNIPFLPISFFKSHTVLSSSLSAEKLLRFESSGTTGIETSKHFVSDPDIYKESFMATFRQFYGSPEQYTFVCLLPSYLERGHSSLVYMCQHLIDASNNPLSGFFLNDWEVMNQILIDNSSNRKIFLIGVTYALLDFATAHPQDLSNAIIMETGGMKGRREEWTRTQVHTFLQQQFNAKAIHSEYGMTELLSQAYALNQGKFQCPPFMKIVLRDMNDPKSILEQGNGLINVIDLANIYSSSFIATDDVGKLYSDGCFEVLGRNDHSALRGCSLMTV